MNRKGKIAFVSNSSYSMFYFRKGLLKRLLSDGYEVHVIAPHDHKTADLIELGCIHHAINFSSKSVNPIVDIILFFRLLRTYRLIKPNLIFHYTIKPNIYGTLASSLLVIKSIAVVTGLGYAFINNNWINKLARRMYRFAFGFAYEVWVLNQSDKDILVGGQLVDSRKCVHLPGEGVNTDEFAYHPVPSSRPFIFLLVARMLKDKGVYEYVEAARIVKKEYPDCCLQLLGPADADNPTAIPKSQIKQWHDEGIITYLGATDQVIPHIAAAHVVVLPSYREGISKVLMEAASLGRPLLATRVPGCVELIDEGKNGLLCEVRNAESLAQAMKTFLHMSPEAIQEMGNHSRNNMLRSFDEQHVIGYYFRALAQMELQKPVVAYVVNTDWFFLSHRLPLALEAKQRGYEPIVIATNTGRQAEIEAYGISFINVNFSRSGINPISEIKVLLKLIKWYVTYKPVIVHHVTIKPVLYGSIAATFTWHRIKVVNAISGLGYAFINTYRTLSFWVIRAMMRIVFKSKQVNFIFQNPDDLKFYHALGYLKSDNNKLIRGAGIDLNQWMYMSPVIKSKLRVLFSGRMLEDKGVFEFIHAAHLLYEKWKDKAEFVMLGGTDPGNPKSISEHLIEQALVSGYLEWKGHTEFVFDECVSADIVCLPSYREGLPKSLLEAMAVGRPIVTTDVPGCRECVDDQVNGFIVPARNHDQLAQSIDQLLSDASLRLAMGHASRNKVVAEFSLDSVVNQTFAFYDELLGRKQESIVHYPKISIITAVYNNKLFLKDAIESVIHQQYPNLEYIVIDGGSDDGSMDIVKQYENKITHVVSEPDKGLYDALNKGISMATGEIIGIMHSDDFYAHRYVLKKVAAQFSKDTDAVFGDLDYVSNENPSVIIRKWRTKRYQREKFTTGWMPPHPTVFIRKEVFSQYGAYHTQLRSSADYELLIRLFYIHRIHVAFLREVLVKMRIGGQSNRTLTNRLKAHVEDYKAWQVAGANPAVYTMIFKLLRKIPQYRIGS